MTTDATQDPTGLDADARRREHRAWYFYDWANSAYVTTTQTVLFGPYLTVVAKRAACPGQDPDEACRATLDVLGVPIAPGSVALYTITVATLLSAVLLPLVGAIADRSAHKRTILAGIAWAGAAAASAMVFVSGANWQLGVLLQIFATLCLGSSLVVYGGILCEIATPDERDEVSSRGWAMGYLGGTVLLAFNLGLMAFAGSLGISTETAVRINLLSAGLWWGLWTLVPYRGLRDRPPVKPLETGIEPAPGPVDDVRAAVRQLNDTLRHLLGYRQTLLFLLAYILYNDGIQTVVYAAAIFGQEELGFRADQLVTMILIVQFVAFCGALLFGRVARRIGAKATVLGGLVLWCPVVASGYVIPEGQFLVFSGLGVLIGIVLGGTQALSRSLFSQLIPRGREAEYFSLYQLAERGTSWIGTLMFGLVYQLSGSYRHAVGALVLFFVVGGLLLLKVDVRRGIAEAGNEQPAVV